MIAVGDVVNVLETSYLRLPETRRSVLRQVETIASAFLRCTQFTDAAQLFLRFYVAHLVIYQIALNSPKSAALARPNTDQALAEILDQDVYDAQLPELEVTQGQRGTKCACSDNKHIELRATCSAPRKAVDGNDVPFLDNRFGAYWQGIRWAEPAAK